MNKYLIKESEQVALKYCSVTQRNEMLHILHSNIVIPIIYFAHLLVICVCLPDNHKSLGVSRTKPIKHCTSWNRERGGFLCVFLPSSSVVRFAVWVYVPTCMYGYIILASLEI